MRTLKGKKVLVTGAASGIGRAAAIAFAERGADMILCCDKNVAGLAATREKVEALGQRVILDKSVDVSKAEDMARLADDVEREAGVLDVLVNNAGISLVGGLLDTSLEDWDAVVGTNLRGVIHGCHYFVPPMVKRGQGGHVVNVASASAFVSFASSVAYSASKFGVLGLSEGLREELRPHGIGVTTLCPGLVKTSITQNALYRGEFRTEASQRQFKENVSKRGSDPAKVANVLVDAVERNLGLVTVTFDAWAAYMLKRVSPALTSFVGRKFAESMSPKVSAP